jgi:uncharacterized protein DUF3421/CARDB protein
MKTYFNITTMVAVLVFGCHAMVMAQRQNTNTGRSHSPQPTQTTATSPTSTSSSPNRVTETVTRLPDLMFAEVTNCKGQPIPADSSNPSSLGDCFKFRIKNQGLGDATSTMLLVSVKGRLYEKPFAAEKLVAVPALAHGHDAWITVNDQALGCPCTSVVLTARLDAKNEIKESDRNNNRVLRAASSEPKKGGTKGSTKKVDPNASQVPFDDFQWVYADQVKSMAISNDLNEITVDHTKEGVWISICRAQMPNGEHPGKLFGDVCYVPWNGKEYVFEKKETSGFEDTNYQVLLTRRYSSFEWVPVSQLALGEAKKWAIEGGYVSNGNNSLETLYICRMKFNDYYHAGKFLSSTSTCYVSWNGAESINTSGFEVLMGH